LVYMQDEIVLGVLLPDGKWWPLVKDQRSKAMGYVWWPMVKGHGLCKYDATIWAMCMQKMLSIVDVNLLLMSIVHYYVG
jgi:hypothetical protein